MVVLVRKGQIWGVITDKIVGYHVALIPHIER